MRVAMRSCALLLAAAAASAADSDADALFQKARAKVLDNARRLPRYTCVENILRAQYMPPRGALAAFRRPVSQGALAVRDRLRLDVAVVNGDEIFSWAGAGKFETHDVAKLVGRGASGSG